MRISVQSILITQVIAAILPGALMFTGCGTFGSRYDSGEESRAAKAAAEALNEMNREMAGEGDIFEPGIQAKIPSIEILRPTDANLAADEGYIPDMARTTLNNNFRKFAQGYITVTNINAADEDALQAEVQKSLLGSNDELSLTSRVAARALMTGKITKIADKRFNLDFSITDTETHVVLAGYNRTHSDIELTGGIAVNRMTEYFLGELGVRLNEAGKWALLVGNSNEAETALAKGLMAANAGQNLEALNYLYNAENFDITREAAAGSLAAVQTRNREDLGAGARITAYFESQALWQGRLDEYSEFYRNHPPFELFYTPPAPGNMRGSGDSGTYDLSFKIGLRWNQNQIDVMERVLKEYILDGLYQNSQSDIDGWELKGLPEDSELFRGPENFSYNLVINVENERGEVIVSGPTVLSGSLYYYNGRIYADCTQEFNAAFPRIRYVREQMTDQLYIRIANINGIDIKTVGENGFMRVVQNQELPPAQSNILPREFLAKKQREQEEAAKAAERKRKRREEAAKAAERERKRQGAYFGSAVTGGYTLGTEETAVINTGFFFGSNFWNLDLGFMFYPGMQLGHLSENSSSDPGEFAMGIDAGLNYVLAGSRWFLNVGGGVTFFMAWADSSDDFFVIPYLKLCFDWHLFWGFYLRAGYRMDIYPAEKFYTYFKSETKKTVADQKFADNIFLGISLY
jgi:hypothetical protein